MTARKLDDEQLDQVVGGCYSPDHPAGHDDRNHICVGSGTLPPPVGEREDTEKAGGPGDEANLIFGE